MELWKYDEGFERYKVFDNGRVWNKRVRCLETGEVFNSAAEATRQHKIQNPNAVSNAANPKRLLKKAGGVHWEYL